MTSNFKDSDDLQDVVNQLNRPYKDNPVKLKNKDADNLKLSEDHKRLVAGSLLGDASLKAPTGKYKNTHIQMKHSKKQANWVEWKANKLEPFIGRIPFCGQVEPIFLKDPETGEKIYNLNSEAERELYEKIRFTTRHLKCLTEFFLEVTTNGELDFTKPWVHQYICEFALMVWWLDDGGLTGKNNACGRFNTQGFPKQKIEELKKLLLNKWGIQTTFQTKKDSKFPGTVYNLLDLNEKNLQKFLILIMPHIPIKEMLYKAIPYYKHSHTQKRWISTMYQHIKPELHQDLTDILRSKFASKMVDFEEFIQTVDRRK